MPLSFSPLFKLESMRRKPEASGDDNSATFHTHCVGSAINPYFSRSLELRLRKFDKLEKETKQQLNYDSSTNNLARHYW
jgi:hypothetical protein